MPSTRVPRALPVLTILVGFLLLSGPGLAHVEARIDLRSQRMNVVVDGRLTYVWRVSTARRGYVTPRGSYRPQRLYRHYSSQKYDNAPMPHAVFFRGGYAIHGTHALRSLGRPASHGCIRLAPGHARELFRLIRLHGRQETRIVIF